MNPEQFAARVRVFEARSQRHPQFYQAMTLLLAGLGSLYILLILIILTALIDILLVIMILIPSATLFILLLLLLLLPSVLLIAGAMWVRIPEAGGLLLQRRYFPKLFTLLDELRRDMTVPPLHRVILSGDFNARVRQTPRLGVLGFIRNDLLIGLPLLQALSTVQLKAILAHELGHLARGHGRMGNWLYRQRIHWLRILQALEAKKSCDILLLPFLRWFVPYFAARVFPLARLSEYQADADAARLTSPRALAEALTNLEVMGGYFSETYWPALDQRAHLEAQPAAPYTEFAAALHRDLVAEAAQARLECALQRTTNPADTHPALSDRLRALGESPYYVPPIWNETAATLLEPHAALLAANLDQDWQETIGTQWRQCYAESAGKRTRLAELAAQAAGGELPVERALERAMLTEQLGDEEAAFAQLQALHTHAPDAVLVCLAYGSRLLARDDPAGEAILEHAILQDISTTRLVCETLRDDHARHGRDTESDAWVDRLAQHAILERRIAEERQRLWHDDYFMPHGLDRTQITALQAELRAIPELRRVYLVRKQVELLPEILCYILGFVVTGCCQLYSKRRVQNVTRQLHNCKHIPNNTLIANLELDLTVFQRKLRRVPGAQLLPEPCTPDTLAR